MRSAVIGILEIVYPNRQGAHRVRVEGNNEHIVCVWGVWSRERQITL